MIMVAAGIILVLAVGQAVRLAIDARDEGAAPSGTGTSTALPMRDEEGAPAACRGLVDGAELVVAEARVGIASLTELVGAYEGWIGGRISDRRMTAVYENSRLFGPDEVRRYVDVQARYANVETEACAGQSEDCTTRVQALKVSLAAGRSGMTLWDKHLTDLADLTAVEVGAEEVQALWDRTRAELPAVTSAWNDAEQELRKAPSCD